MEWRKLLVPADAVLKRIRPGMSVLLSTGAAEPRSLVKHLMAAHSAKLQDLELIQIVSFADAISLKNLQSQKFRLKTFQQSLNLEPKFFSHWPTITSNQRRIDDWRQT